MADQGITVEYKVCNRLLDAETNEHCEFDGDVEVRNDRSTYCPSCGGTLIYRSTRKDRP